MIEHYAYPRFHQVKPGNIRVMLQGPEGEGNHGIILENAKAELAKAKEELNRAKESSMQSWLDSEPLIDELEKQKANLANAQLSENSSKTVTEKLESQLETIHKSIKSKREEQLKTELMIQETNQNLDHMRNEMEMLKLERNKEKQTLAKLRQTLHLRKQTAQTLQLTLRAVLLESDAVEESSAKALQQIKLSENHRDVVQLTNEKYYALTRRAKEKISHTNSRVSVYMEQKHAAQATHDLVLSRLNKIYSSRSWSMNKRKIMGLRYTERSAKGQDTIIEEEVMANVSPKSSAEESLPKFKGGKLQQSRKSVSNHVKIVRKKSSILYKLRKCLYGS
ncbi:protein BCAP-like [Vigna unguiculata]|uniref:protein BCAP-like n=1 Tax=Vigna unguiculata TaxID=3917 RepID=UPI001016FEBE|nr:protein BCAP-like [Vigna unguiculata]